MTNGKLPTWFIVKWLEKHPTHTATAYRERAYMNDGRVHFEHMPNRHDVWFTSEMLEPRSDWTIYNERWKRVRFKRKPNWRKLLCSVVNSYDAVCSSYIDNDATHTAACVKTEGKALMQAREALERYR